MNIGKEKLIFSSTINDFDDHLPKGRTECFDYGICNGCDCDCPVFRRGQCTLDDFDAIISMIDNNTDEEEANELYNLYPYILEYKNKKYNDYGR